MTANEKTRPDEPIELRESAGCQWPTIWEHQLLMGMVLLLQVRRVASARDPRLVTNAEFQKRGRIPLNTRAPEHDSSHGDVA